MLQIRVELLLHIEEASHACCGTLSLNAVVGFLCCTGLTITLSGISVEYFISAAHRLLCAEPSFWAHKRPFLLNLEDPSDQPVCDWKL